MMEERGYCGEKEGEKKKYGSMSRESGFLNPQISSPDFHNPFVFSDARYVPYKLE
jgi:hypothetical protein